MDTKTLFLYGSAKVNYGTINLEAEEIEIDYLKNELIAQGKTDSAGKVIGTPVFTENSQKYSASHMRYNYKTRKGKIKGIIAQEGEGYIHGENVKKNTSDELFIKHAKYTTCNLAEPHFYFLASRVKLIPNKRVIAGPFNLFINGIPTPLGFPFGYFPLPKDNTSGIISFRVGETALNGFFIGQGGYYWHISDHLDAKVTGDIFTLGGYRANFESNYSKRYAFTGRVTLGTSNKVNGVGSGPGNEFTWTHIPTPKGLSSFSANVKISSFNFNRNNSPNLNNLIAPSYTSDVKFSTGIRNTPMTMSISLRHAQNEDTKLVTLTLPSINFSTSNIYPFKKKLNPGNNWYESLSISYVLNAENKISNSDYVNPSDAKTRIPFGENLSFLVKNAKMGVEHRVALNTTFKTLKYISVTPGFNYLEHWYPSQLVYSYNPIKEQTEIIDTIKQFSRPYSYTTSVQFSTVIYGTKKFRGKLQGIRHTITPTLTVSYNPDFSKTVFGAFDNFNYTDGSGNSKIASVSKYTGYMYGGPSAGRSGLIGMSINNVLEIKVKTKNDTTQNFKKIKIFDGLNFSSGYNLLADSMNLQSISINLNKTLGKFSFNTTAIVDPYVYITSAPTVSSTGEIQKIAPRKTSEYAWKEKFALGKLTTATMSLSANLSPFFKKNKKTTANSTNSMQYVDWDIPWNLSLNYTIAYTYVTTTEKFNGNILGITGNISISPKWKIDVRTNFDIRAKKLTDDTRLMLIRDLHCWEFAAEWIPFGIRASYSVQLRVKASILRDLKLEKNRSWLYN